MAATQAEKQQNDVNSEKVQPDQHLNVRNSLLQNGTDKSGVRGGGSVVVTKGKNTGGKNFAIEMSQYRQDGSGVSTTGPVPGPGPTIAPGSGGPNSTGSGTSGSAASSEQGLGGEPESSAGGGVASTDSNMYSTEGGQGPSPAVAADGHYGFPYVRDVHNSADAGGVHAFGPRHPFAGPKQLPPHQHQAHQRFVMGQSVPQPTGPTPTLNQLLQASTPHRFTNNYGHPDQHYNQGWPPQKPLPQQGYGPTAPGSAPPPAPYRTQPSLEMGGLLKVPNVNIEV